MLIHVSLQLMHFWDFDLDLSGPACKELPISLGFMMMVLLSCYLVVPGVVRKYVTSVEWWVPYSDNQQFPSSAHLLDINRRVREVHVSHSSQLWRSRVYHSRIKNEHSTQGERKISIILLALKHHNKETKSTEWDLIFSLSWRSQASIFYTWKEHQWDWLGKASRMLKLYRILAARL